MGYQRHSSPRRPKFNPQIIKNIIDGTFIIASILFLFYLNAVLGASV